MSNPSTPDPIIPPLPPAIPSWSSAKPKSLIETSYAPMDDQQNLFQIIDALLKHPGRILHELLHGKRGIITLILLGITILCLAAIGLMMASYSGGLQFSAVPLKVIGGTLLGAAICLPSLYILLCLSGGTQTFPQTCAILCQGLALAGLLFVGFLPVAWIFSQATDSTGFMGGLYLIIWGVGLHFGLRLIQQNFSFLNKRPMGTLRLWNLIFILVLLQMSTTLRPLIGPYQPLNTTEKKFFLTHWFDAGSNTTQPGPPK